MLAFASIISPRRRSHRRRWHVRGCVFGNVAAITDGATGYDAQGNVTNKDGIHFDFDYANRLHGAVYDGATLETYWYDACGRRVISNASSGMIQSIYSQGGQLLYQKNARTGKRTNYYYLSGSLVAEVDTTISSGTVSNRYQHTDALGSPVVVTNGPHSILERNEYEPYGFVLKGGYADRPGFTGHVSDAKTGLDYMQQRYYDPSIGAMLSVDPVTAYEKPLTNFCRYCYARNNPYKFTDPDGRDILVISGGLREGGFNWAGHVASAVEGDGMSSYGNDTPRHSSVADYIQSQSKLRPQQITIVPRTPQQDAAAREKAATLPTKVTKLDNCAVRTNQILEAAGVSTSVVPLPKVTETVAAEQPGAITYQIPKGGEIPKVLLDQLPKFEAPKKVEKTQ